MPGVSSMTASTRSRWRMFSRTGVMMRYQTTSAVTEPYSAYQAVFAAGSTTNSLPVDSWCQKVRNVAAYVSRCTWYQRSYGILRRTGPMDMSPMSTSRPVPIAALPMSGSWFTESTVCWTMSPNVFPAWRAYPYMIRTTCATTRQSVYRPLIACQRATRSEPTRRSSAGTRAIWSTTSAIR